MSMTSSHGRLMVNNQTSCGKRLVLRMMLMITCRSLWWSCGTSPDRRCPRSAASPPFRLFENAHKSSLLTKCDIAQCSSCQLGCYRSILSEIRVWSSQKLIFLMVPHIKSTLRQIYLEIAWQNWPFKIGLSLFDFKQLLVDSGIIVHWLAFALPPTSIQKRPPDGFAMLAPSTGLKLLTKINSSQVSQVQNIIWYFSLLQSLSKSLFFTASASTGLSDYLWEKHCRKLKIQSNPNQSVVIPCQEKTFFLYLLLPLRGT